MDWSAWLTRVAVNACRDRRRSGWWRWWRERGVEIDDRRVRSVRTPEDELIGRETQARIWSAYGRLPARQREDVAAAFHELLMNAVEHGGHYDPQKWVRVSAIRAERAMIYHIQDPGNGFSLDNIPHAAISNPLDAPVHHVEVRMEQGVRPGGFGILLTRHLVDELIYNERGNEVLFVKYL